MIKPLADRIVVREVKIEQKTASGILLDSQQVTRHKEGDVVAVGRGRIAEPTQSADVGLNVSHFAFYPMEVNVGDRVVYTFGDEYTLDGEKYYIIRENDILAIVTDK